MRYIALAVAALVAAVLTQPAAAHREVVGVSSVLDSIEPPLPDGVTVQVVRSVADQVVAENTTSTDLDVLGEDGEPFLRIGPRGAEANLASADWYRSNSPEGTGTVPADLQPGAPARWAQISADPSWGWFDHRLHQAPLSTPPAAAIGQEVVLERWEIPMRMGEGEIHVRGRRIYSLPVGGFHHRIESPIPGMQVSVLDGRVPAIFITAPGDEPVELIGVSGEPFARLGPGGAEVNDASPTWMLTARSEGEFDAAGPVGAEAEPRWRQVNPVAQLIWLEPRAVPPADGKDHVWTVPARVDGQEVALQGRSEWVAAPVLPARDRDRSFPVAAVVGVTGVVLACAGGWLVGSGFSRRRKRAAPNRDS